MTNFWTDYIFPFVTVIVLLIVYFTLKNLLPSYFSEKGKNLATKEDISQLTELVEKVKYTFIKETERLKSDLQFVKGIHGSLVSEERNAIVDFNEKYFTWLNVVADAGLNGINKNDNNEIDKFLQVLHQYYSSLLNSHSRFDLFIENAELTTAAHSIKIEALELFGSLPQTFLIEMKGINVERLFLDQNTTGNDRLEKTRALLTKRLQLQKEYAAKVIGNYKVIALKAAKFQVLCRRYMYELIEKANG